MYAILPDDDPQAPFAGGRPSFLCFPLISEDTRVRCWLEPSRSGSAGRSLSASARASRILGLECSGWIESVGEGVSGWSVGDPVCALLSGGGYAETVARPAGQVFPLPSGVTLTEGRGAPGGPRHGMGEPRRRGRHAGR